MTRNIKVNITETESKEEAGNTPHIQNPLKKGINGCGDYMSLLPVHPKTTIICKILFGKAEQQSCVRLWLRGCVSTAF